MILLAAWLAVATPCQSQTWKRWEPPRSEPRDARPREEEKPRDRRWWPREERWEYRR